MMQSHTSTISLLFISSKAFFDRSNRLYLWIITEKVGCAASVSLDMAPLYMPLVYNVKSVETTT